MYVHKYSHQYVYLYLFKQRGNIRKKKNGGDGIVINPQMVSLDVRMMTARMAQWEWMLRPVFVKKVCAMKKFKILRQAQHQVLLRRKVIIKSAKE